MIRIKDIAEKAGVSPTTVSNVIHGNRKKVSKNTMKKIEKILTEMDYVPSMGAMMLAGGSSRIIGVLAWEPDRKKYHSEGPAFSNIVIRSLESEIYNRNYYMLLHFVSSPEEGIQFAAIWNVEGLITLGFGAKDNVKLQSKCKVPVVSIDAYYKEQQVANVGLDDRGGGYLMAEYLIQCGHEKIGFVSDNDVGVDHERWKGVCSACKEYNVPEEGVKHIIIPGETHMRRKFYEKYLDVISRKYDALFFASDYYAVEAIAEMADRGIQVPEEVSVAGFDDNKGAELCRPRLTTIHQEAEAKACRAVGKLFDFIRGVRKISMTERLPVTLVIRDSVLVRES